MIASMFDKSINKEYLFLTHFILSLIILILKLSFFILLSVYYYKGKYKKFLDFRKCEFIDTNKFNDIYKYIFTVYNNCKVIFFSYIIS